MDEKEILKKINRPNWGLHLTPLRGAGEAGH